MEPTEKENTDGIENPPSPESTDSTGIAETAEVTEVTEVTEITEVPKAAGGGGAVDTETAEESPAEKGEGEEDEDEGLGTQSTVEETGPCRRLIKAEVPSEKVLEILDKNYREIISTFQIPGFRRGKVPRPLVEKRLGKEIEKEVKESLLEDSFQEVLEEKELRIVGQPKFDKVEFKKGESFSYEVEVEIRPDFNIGDYKGLEIKAVGDEEAPPITDEIVEDQILRIRKKHAELVVIDPDKATPADVYYGHYTLEIDGLQVHRKDEVLFRPDSGHVEGFLIPDLAEKVASTGASMEFSADVKVPDNYSEVVLQGKDGKLNINIEQIKRPQPPELDEEFAKLWGVDSVDEIRAQVRQELELQREQKIRDILDDRILDRIGEGVQFDLPEGLLEEQTKLSRTKMELSLLQAGVPRKTIDEELKKVDEKGSDELRKEIRHYFIIEKIAELEKIFATEDEVKAQISLLALTSDRPEKVVMEELEESGRIDTIRAEIRNSKVRKFLRKASKIVKEEESGKQPPAGEPSPTAGAASEGENPPIEKPAGEQTKETDNP